VEFSVQTSDFRVQRSKFRVRSSEFKLQLAGIAKRTLKAEL